MKQQTQNNKIEWREVENESVLKFDKTIWQIFAIGITASVVILYHVVNPKSTIPESLKIWALTLGFSILIYSFILTLGYGAKKGIIDNSFFKRLNNIWYPRTRWMGEIILIFIGIIYFLSFNSYWYIPMIILLIFILLCCIANCCINKDSQEKEKLTFSDYLLNYFCIKKIKLKNEN